MNRFEKGHVECIIQCLPYNGFPRVQQALVILKQVIEE